MSPTTQFENERMKKENGYCHCDGNVKTFIERYDIFDFEGNKIGKVKELICLDCHKPLQKGYHKTLIH